MTELYLKILVELSINHFRHKKLFCSVIALRKIQPKCKYYLVKFHAQLSDYLLMWLLYIAVARTQKLKILKKNMSCLLDPWLHCRIL